MLHKKNAKMPHKREVTTKHGMLRAKNLDQPRKFYTSTACDASENFKGFIKSYSNMLYRWLLSIDRVATGVDFFSFRITGTRYGDQVWHIIKHWPKEVHIDTAGV